MNIETEMMGPLCAVKLFGRLDAVTAPELEAAMNSLIEDGQTRVVMNLKDLEYVSSAGLRCFLLAAKKLKALQGELSLAAMAENTREVIRISGFSAIMPCYDTMADVPTD